MRRKFGVLFMFLGVTLLIGAAALFLNNKQEDAEAGKSVSEVLPQLQVAIPEEPDHEALNEELIPADLMTPEQAKMTEVEIDGLLYIGYLSIPSLELDLPVLSEWSYDLLQKAPCRYLGSSKTDDLVLMAHNYDKHFGRLMKIETGESVYFTDMDGIVTGYEVIARDVLVPTAVEEVGSGAFDLTLFTCTYGGQSRVTVYCDRIS